MITITMHPIKLFKFLPPKLFMLIAIIALQACMQTENADVKSELAPAPVSLSVGEGFINPVGYYEQKPRFSWKLNSESSSNFQQAYQLQVFSSMPDITKSAALWDSKKQDSSQNSWVQYEGQPLQSRQKAFWRVRVWDENNKPSSWSELASFELGLLRNSEWRAKWIRHPETGETYQRTYRNNTVENKLYRPQYLRKQFNTQGQIKQARLYVTSKGIFEAYINGGKVSQDVMTPGWTPYLQRIETLTYDVTSLLQGGNNTLGAIVAEGWHTGRILSPQKRDVKPSAFLAQLEIQYQDGTIESIETDSSWKVTLNGPVRSAGIYDGETYDANLEMPNWSRNDFNDANWNSVIAETLDKNVELSPKRHTPATTKLIIPAVEIVQVANPKPGVLVFDMGQNMLGVPKLNIPVLAKQKVTARFAEALEHNKFYTKNLRSALATDHYIPAKSGFIEYTPSFTFHGYRYVELSGFDPSKPPQLDWVKGLVQHSNFKVQGNFKSSKPKLNKLAENIIWGLRGNFLDIPTDCPQRDERLGWTGDAQVFAGPSMYMADVYGFWSAWLQSVREEQDVNGRIPNFIPTKQNRHTKGASSGWGDAAVIIPWELYELTGDIQILRENYDMIQGWLNFHESKSKDYISNMNSFRDWLQPFPKQEEQSQRRRGDTPQKLISTAYYARSLDYAAKAASVLGFEDDAKNYREKLSSVKVAFRNAFYNKQTRVLTTQTQTSYLLPLAFNLFEREDHVRAQQHLIDLINSAENHLGTGFLGTPLLAPVLQEMGRSDLMYELLFKETYPSWFYSINNGATTTWERWDSYSLSEGFSKESMNSLNHYAYGAVSRWFYEGILGINSLSAGYKKIEIAPQFTKSLKYASGSYQTPQGEVSVHWEIKNNKLNLQIVVPKNTQANFALPQLKFQNATINGEPINSVNLVNQIPGTYQIVGELSR